MKIKELIKELQQYDENLDIFTKKKNWLEILER